MKTLSALSPARLDRLRRVMTGYVERNEVPGLVALVSRRGETHVEVVGAQALGGAPMRRDTIFRIASMTKPVVAVATLLLVEACVLRLDDPVDRWLPELANRQVLKRIDGPLDDTEPAHRPITLRDLLTFRLGFGFFMAPPTDPIQQAARELGLLPGPPRADTPGPDEWLARLGSVPLMFQPGDRWLYHTGSEILGVLIARAAAQPLPDFLRERIFEPLGMRDTGFSVPADKLGRLAAGYGVDPATGQLTLWDDPANSQWGRPPAFPSGGGGLVSTADDFLTFARLLLNGGRHGSYRLLSRPAIEVMTTDQLTPAQKSRSGLMPGDFDHLGWGFGVAINTHRTDLATRPGRYGWDGGLGTSWWSDPTEELTGILLTQRAWSTSRPPDVCCDFWTATYQAIDE